MGKTKRVFLIILITLLSITTGVFADSDFKDIKPTDWYYNSIINLTDRSIINGYTDGTFRPNNPVTTAEFLKLSLETAGIEVEKNTNPWHKGVMDKSLSLGIITRDLYNKPNEPIKRKDVAVVLAKLIEKTPSLKDEFITERSKDYDRFKYLLYDTTKLSQEYRNAIYKLFEYQLIIGTTNEKDQVFYKPESNLTRAEIATIIERLIEPSKRLDKYAEYPNRDSIFDNENLRDMTSTYYIKPDIEKERFLFTYDDGKGKIENVILSEELNPYINKQIYELTKVTLDKDKNYFVQVKPTGYNTNDNRVLYSVAKTELHAINNGEIWKFIMSVNKPYNVKKDHYNSQNPNLSEKSIITLRLGSLWQDFAPDGWVDWFYANKLRMSLIALFGEKDGHEIYEYVLDEYIKYRLAGSNESTGYKFVYQTKDIGNIHIDYITGDSATLRFHFSYIR